jgi:hypothetical protein
MVSVRRRRRRRRRCCCYCSWPMGESLERDFPYALLVVAQGNCSSEPFSTSSDVVSRGVDPVESQHLDVLVSTTVASPVLHELGMISATCSSTFSGQRTMKGVVEESVRRRDALQSLAVAKLRAKAKAVRHRTCAHPQHMPLESQLPCSVTLTPARERAVVPVVVFLARCPDVVLKLCRAGCAVSAGGSERRHRRHRTI